MYTTKDVKQKPHFCFSGFEGAKNKKMIFPSLSANRLKQKAGEIAECVRNEIRAILKEDVCVKMLILSGLLQMNGQMQQADNTLAKQYIQYLKAYGINLLLLYEKLKVNMLHHKKQQF